MALQARCNPLYMRSWKFCFQYFYLKAKQETKKNFKCFINFLVFISNQSLIKSWKRRKIAFFTHKAIWRCCCTIYVLTQARAWSNVVPGLVWAQLVLCRESTSGSGSGSGGSALGPRGDDILLVWCDAILGSRARAPVLVSFLGHRVRLQGW